MSLTQRLAELEIDLPCMHGPFGAYVPAKRVGNLIYVAGQLPMKDGKLMATGQVPTRCSVNAAKAAARQCVINALSSVKAVQGSLVALTGVVRLGVFVSCEPGFHEQPKIANGASEFLIELFGETGHHVRTTVGVNSLPLDATVEIEFIFQVANQNP
jgi:enamine deaminase RidA (YjgF/YER057c/UK114 family)